MRQIAELLFQKALAKLEREHRSSPTDWEYICLTAAIAALNAGDTARAVGNLIDFDGPSSEQQSSAEISDQSRMSTAEIRSVFERLKW
jgi:hypothetical protein